MQTQIESTIVVHRSPHLRATLLGILITGCLVVIAGAAAAVPVGSPGPGPGVLPDSGDELFYHNNSVLSLELFDSVGVTGLSKFGFYFGSDHSSLVTIFDFNDQAGTSQAAAINFLTGEVIDVDGKNVESTFKPMAGPIGFFYALTLDPTTSTGIDILAFSEASLNNGQDLVGTYEDVNDPESWLITFESKGITFVVDIVSGIRPIPEPSAALLFMIGFGLTGSLMRSRTR